MEQIEGKNPVREALRAGRRIKKLAAARGAERGLREILQLAEEVGIPVEWHSRGYLDKISQTRAHQGIIAWREPLGYVELEDILSIAQARQEPPFVILLDRLQDPHNLGSVLRTAEAVGAHGVIIPKHRAVGLTATVAKTSAGAVEYVPVAQVTNLSRAIERLKEHGLWIVGADMSGEQLYFVADLTGPIGIVIGAEGKGMSRLVREKCDFHVRLPMRGQLNCLNAAVAAGILMYEVIRQRQKE